MLILLTVLPPDFLNSSGENKQNMSSRFSHFVSFSCLTALMTQFVPVIDRVLSSYAQSTNSLIPADFLQPWREQQQKFAPLS
jgi:hypothetical protein